MKGSSPKVVWTVFLSLASVAVGLLLFFSPVSPVFLLPCVVSILFCLHVFGHPAAAFTLGFPLTVASFQLFSLGRADMATVGLSTVVLWAGFFVLSIVTNQIRREGELKSDEAFRIKEESRKLLNDINFYETRKNDLRERASKRHQLVRVARDLGSQIEPALIQDELLKAAQFTFPSKRIEITIGQNPDWVDSIVIQKKQPVMLPMKNQPSNPLLAVPILSQGVVAGVLRVGGDAGPDFSKEDLRLLEILGNMASVALDNAFLFQRIQENALRDNLTGLWTHKAFSDTLELAILEASRYNQPLSVVLTDVDHFKAVNDSHGHQAGDTVLQGFSSVLTRNVRDIDVVARWGGEEFILLLYQTPHDRASQVAEAIRADLEAQRFSVGRGQVLSITGSFGVATFPHDAASAQQLVRIADQRLYQAKKGGRNQVVMGKAA